MPTKKISDTASRTTRAGVQGGAGYAIVEFLSAFNVLDLTQRQYGIAVVVAGLAVSFVQNVLENRFGWGFLKKIPPPDQPVIDGA